ncbi:1-deoxy-D-xylulose 5-phosphate reductoisomerase [Rubripirellula tenax]|uniref:1-deoxy-D-xylulose 5-phosphate reductoisomerase n=1 Tax=Rubripirellula tenax TaxID=2528015 RepID=A0A5C6FD20_9BACT|nr:1-deoxy-D-xylulose-5-phosphate reductoisomerase [Rubripirellula tenax]TWU58480.1 1-deoxy-D-xylulose 5-phosphate reductoisomerase [Rubripirellula tenax]
MASTENHREREPINEVDANRTLNVAVFGATGSIGTATAEVIAHLNRVDTQLKWRMWAASGHRNLERLAQIVSAADPAPHRAVLSDPTFADSDRARQIATVRPGMSITYGPDALVEVAQSPEVDIVVAAIVGRAGLESTLAAVEAGKRVALANKETLVVAGPLVRRAMVASGAEILPVDSEHSAIFQCMGTSASPSTTQPPPKPKKLILTASGGPFRTWTKEQMQAATVESALAHPTWNMGAKISIDSATMMNKSLEIIEARWLFDLPADAIEVVVHPQSIIHSMVEFDDGSVIAQMSPPDMKLPIQYALTYPRRLECESPGLDRSRRWDLSLEVADHDRFPGLALGFEVAAAGGTAGAVVNAANEEAVGLFLNGQIRFTDIVSGCRDVFQNHTHESDPPLSRLLELDIWARKETRNRFQL